MSSVLNAPTIRPLDEEVINRIAAGEIIQRPTSALKELLENCIDAQATQISISLKDGGYKLLQLQDNGHGIRKEDLAVLCKRHTTSKINAFEDLRRIKTLGFRGEALCSISFVSRLTVLTRTGQMDYGYRAEYTNSEMLSHSLTPCASNFGTTITVEDIFYNNPLRRAHGSRQFSDEFARIMNVVEKYAIHSTSVEFKVKRMGRNDYDLAILHVTSQLDRIEKLYSLDVRNSLLPFDGGTQSSHSNADGGGSFHFQGYVSHVEYRGHRSIFILFINDRSVECTPLKRAIDSVYTSVLSKPTKSFVYLSIQLPPMDVDVNIHPTKREVEFLYKEELIQQLVESVHGVLACSNNARSFTQMKISSLLQARPEATVPPSVLDEDAEKTKNVAFNQKIADYKRVRTDPKQQTLQTCLIQGVGHQKEPFIPFPKRPRNLSSTSIQPLVAPSREIEEKAKDKDQPLHQEIVYACQQIKEDMHQELKNLMMSHCYVGMADQTRAFVQYQTGLYLINIEKLSEDFFFWILLQSYGQCSMMMMETPVHVSDVLKAQGVGNDDEKEIKRWTDELLAKRQELQSLCSIKISDSGELSALPCLLKSYIPDMDYLPSFCWQLSKLMSSWSGRFDELKGLFKVVARFYAVKRGVDDQTEDLKNEFNVQHLLLPAMRSNYLPLKARAEDQSFMRVTSVEELYRKFERC